MSYFELNHEQDDLRNVKKSYKTIKEYMNKLHDLMN